MLLTARCANCFQHCNIILNNIYFEHQISISEWFMNDCVTMKPVVIKLCNTVIHLIKIKCYIFLNGEQLFKIVIMLPSIPVFFYWLIHATMSLYVQYIGIFAYIYVCIDKFNFFIQNIFFFSFFFSFYFTMIFPPLHLVLQRSVQMLSLGQYHILVTTRNDTSVQVPFMCSSIQSMVAEW